MTELLAQLKKDYPNLQFMAHDVFHWSPQEQIVYFAATNSETDSWTLLHETSHAVLNHTTFTSDFHLLQLELAAWEKAKELGSAYSITIEPNHIEDCLDTYRTWLYKRSLCPTCSRESLQHDEKTYGCLNCGKTWRVSANRLCRPYRASKRLTIAKTTA